jgi:hypothetical protein
LSGRGALGFRSGIGLRSGIGRDLGVGQTHGRLEVTTRIGWQGLRSRGLRSRRRGRDGGLGWFCGRHCVRVRLGWLCSLGCGRGIDDLDLLVLDDRGRSLGSRGIGLGLSLGRRFLEVDLRPGKLRGWHCISARLDWLCSLGCGRGIDDLDLLVLDDRVRGLDSRGIGLD